MAKKEHNTTLGQKLQQVRKSKKLSYDDIAERASVSEQIIEDIEKGMVSPSIGVLKKIIKV
ncbi:MAG: helix-turn-helix domain-containing protein, partial [Spirochaetia bacterium]